MCVALPRVIWSTYNQLTPLLIPPRVCCAVVPCSRLQAVKKLVTDPADVEGLPATALGLAAQTAVSEGHEGATAEKGPWVFTLDFPSYYPVMTHAKNRWGQGEGGPGVGLGVGVRAAGAVAGAAAQLLRGASSAALLSQHPHFQLLPRHPAPPTATCTCIFER